MWHDGGLPIVARLALLSFSGKQIFPLSATLGACLIGAVSPTHDLHGKRPSLRRVARYVCTASAFAICLFYAASWGAFYSTGGFLNPSGAELFWATPVEFLQHIILIDPLTGLCVLVLGGFGTIATLWWIAPRIRRFPVSMCKRVTMVAIAAIEFCVIGAGWGEIGFERDTSPVSVTQNAANISRDVAQAYVVARDERTGPMAHLHAWYSRRRIRNRVPRVSLTVAVDTPSIVPMEKYLKRVSPAARHRWNVIILEVESLRSDRLLIAGGNRRVMPNVELLARDSRVYPQAVANATHSNYASLVPLSGQYPLRSPEQYIYGPQPPYPRVLIYDILKALGYETAVMSSQNELWGGMYYFLNTGAIDRFMHAETYRGPTYVPGEDAGFGEFTSTFNRAGKIDDRYTVTEAVKWLDSLYLQGATARPFFMYMNLQSSHVPYQRPADFPPRFGTGHVSFPIKFNKFPRDSVHAVLDMYDNSLAYADAQIGRLLDHLKSAGLWDSTVFVLTGDHGQAFYEHGFAAHGNLPFAELVRVPLIIHAPGLTPVVDDRPAQHVDVAPTILSLLGLPSHPAYQGTSLTSKQFARDRPLFIVAQAGIVNGFGIIRGRYTLILDDADKRELLFDDASDPSQRHDLASQLPVMRESLRHDLDMWREVQLSYYLRRPSEIRTYAPTLRF